jgi:hypothetical protein
MTLAALLNGSLLIASLCATMIVRSAFSTELASAFAALPAVPVAARRAVMPPALPVA